MQTTVLIVEDEVDLANIIEELLQNEGYITIKAETGSEALKKIEKSAIDLVLLDLGLPDISGETVLQNIRKYFTSLPVVILTAKSKASEIAEGLNLGADDYLPKPFAAEELLARIKARLRKNLGDQKKIKVADLEIDLDMREVKRGDKDIPLTKTEFELLEYLIANKGKVLTRDVILNRIWAYSPDIESRVVDVYVGYLRKKIDSGHKTKLIHNKYGVGYFLKE